MRPEFPYCHSTVLGGCNAPECNGTFVNMSEYVTSEYQPAWDAQEGVEDAVGAPMVNGRKPQRFTPFGQGNRDCVGQTLARLNLATTLPQLYGNFTFRLADEVRRWVYNLLDVRLPLRADRASAASVDGRSGGLWAQYFRLCSLSSWFTLSCSLS